MELTVFGEKIDTSVINSDAQQYLQSLPAELPSVEWIWSEMNRVWQDQGLDNRVSLDKQDIGRYYSHPIWLVNGIFTALDKESVRHRQAIRQFLDRNGLNQIADYGGGSGVLANIITENENTTVDIIEPYPADFYVNKYQHNHQINYIPDFAHHDYQAVIAQDVLEHVENPVKTAFTIASHARNHGYLIFANCFYPVIECHLPRTFYLRHTFPLIMKAMGLTYLGRMSEANHVQVFQKNKPINLDRALIAARLAKLVAPPLQLAEKWVRWVRSLS